jgi:hypothetical protein
VTSRDPLFQLRPEVLDINIHTVVLENSTAIRTWEVSDVDPSVRFDNHPQHDNRLRRAIRWCSL